MVARKPLPRSENADGDGDVPAVLRPGRNPRPSPAATSPYSNFEAEEESVWRQPAPMVPQTTASQGYQLPQQPASTSIPTILLQTATGSSTSTASRVETNPFKKKMLAAVELPADSPASSSSPSAPPPAPPLPPAASFAQLGIDEPVRNPWQPALGDSSSHGSPVPPPIITDTATAGGGEDVWASQNTSEQPSRRPSPGAPNARYSDANLISFAADEEGDIAGWDEVAAPGPAPAAVPGNAPPTRPPFAPLDGRGSSMEEDDAVYEDRHAWDDLGGAGSIRNNGAQGLVASSQSNALPSNLVTEPAGEGWNLVDSEPVPGQLSRQSTWENFSDDEDDADRKKAGAVSKGKAKGKAVDPGEPGPSVPEPLITIDSPSPTGQTSQSNQSTPQASTDSRQSAVLEDEGPVPQLPPRSMLDVGDDVPPPRQPPRPAQSDKTETYQIKNATWYDIRAARNPRVSPILVQNANGPCPLVALVNALTLTTPADTLTALVETLRSREQVSLSLLLDAVFDELMSSRRSNNDSDLPDVDELYKFLKGLHTGMNVNPRFIPTAEVVTAFRRTSLTHLHPTERDEMIPGTFEDTREMQLYATFNIPLIHGWLPSKNDGAYEALSRQAASYEDVQNLLFREEELEEKLSSPTGDGLTEEEQGLYQDILEIKTFLHVSATQLTPYGLDVVGKAMRPGSFAILFRNDHFSTLYRHPQTMQLLSLVTDAGYAGHDEVIWETLADVNGERAEFYSGDFRLVGGNSHQEQQQRQDQYNGAGASGRGGGASSSNQGGWTTVRGRHHKANSQPEVHQPSSEELSRHEQEDRDLALALQLQEEEEERHRAEEERRNSRLSEQFIEQNARPAAQNANSSGRRPSNAAGGGRYTSAQQVPVSPRRSSASYYSNNSMLSDNNRRTSSSSTSGSALGTSLSNGQRGGQYRGRTPSTSSSQLPQQVIRPLVPPAATTRIVSTRPAVHREAEADAGDEAPPSYEQAAKQAPYHPPPGAPGSETALAGSSSTAESTTGTPVSTRPTAPSPRLPTTYASTSGRPFVPPAAFTQQQPIRQQQTATNRADRDCTIM